MSPHALYMRCSRCEAFGLATPTGDVPDAPRGWIDVQGTPPLPITQAIWRAIYCAPCWPVVSAAIEKSYRSAK